MRRRAALAACAALSLGASADVPPELRGRVSAEVISCEPFQARDDTRVVLVRIRAGASGVKKPEIRCGAVVPGSDEALEWARVSGLDRVAADAVREAMVLVPADAAHSECRCAVATAEPGAQCAPWEAFEGGRCVEPGDVAAPPPEPQGELAAALEVSRALAPVRTHLAARPPKPGARRRPVACAAVHSEDLGPLVFALAPEEGTVYVRPLWHRLDALDQRAFALWARECSGAPRIVDSERGAPVSAPPPAP